MKALEPDLSPAYWAWGGRRSLSVARTRHFERVFALLRIVVQCLLCLFIASSARITRAVEPEVVELEEEPAAGETPKSSRAKKKTKKPAEEEVVEVIEVPDEPEPKPKPKSKAKAKKKAAPVEEAEEEVEEAEEEPEAPPDIGGLECSPAVTEVETRRPIPISCGVTKDGVSRIEIRYKPPGQKKVTRLALRKDGDEWTGEIPCGATAKSGDFKLSFTARGAGDRVIAKINTVTIQLVEASEEMPPSFPGKDPPMRCYDAAECPAEFRGTAACPGTKVSGSASKSWGASCAASSECQAGLACVNGTCDQPPKCETTSECPSGGECVEGVCSFPDPADAASRLGEPRFNWIGLHFGLDVLLVRDAVGVCGNETADSEDYTCFRGGDPYSGTVNTVYNEGGKVNAGFRMATMRVMASYDRWFGRFAAGARVGFAFGGAPEDFNPLHLEVRALYSMRRDPLRQRLRPYLGLMAGLAQADPKSKTRVVDCTDASPNCEDASLEELAAPGNFPGAAELSLDAYRTGSTVFFGPALGVIYAFSNEQAMQLNVNAMFPDLVVQPSLGYVMGL